MHGVHVVARFDSCRPDQNYTTIMQVRQATTEDSYRILDLYREFVDYLEMISEKPPIDWTDDQEDSQMTRLVDFLGKPNQGMFVVGNDYETVGFASYIIQSKILRDEDCMYIEDFFVSENFRGQSFGKKMFIALKDFAKSKGIKIIKLNTGIELSLAQQFYTKMGGLHTENRFRFDI